MLKQVLHSVDGFEGNSDSLVTTNFNPAKGDPRDFHLDNVNDSPPPVISSSEFVPHVLVEHLMRNKKSSALGVKYLRGGAITNMEGAMHTFVTPITSCWMYGDYHFKNGHSVRQFETVEGKQQARRVVVSAAIQPDFEYDNVLLALCALKESETKGQALVADFKIPSAAVKSNDADRSKYEALLKAHMIFYLTKDKRLPAITDARRFTCSVDDAIRTVEREIMESSKPDVHQLYVKARKGILSVEMLFNTAVHSLRNELSALEGMCPQGYIYTSDPPSIFARELEPKLLNRIQMAALKQLSSENSFKNMKIFAFNDYADPQATTYLQKALSLQLHVKALAKKDLFNDGQRPGKLGYRPIQGTEGALLVLHNNSDAFGQNIETEGPRSSLDGALGVNSSCAASLYRTREDLLSKLM